MVKSIQSQFNNSVLLNFAAVRALLPPQDDTLVNVLGAVTRNDGGEGKFYYSSSATTADDDDTVLKPDSIKAEDPGRWVRSGGAAGYEITTPTIITLRALSEAESDNEGVYVTGRVTRNDGGQSMYLWDSASTVADDGFYTIKPDSVDAEDPGRWVRQDRGGFDLGLTNVAALRAIPSLTLKADNIIRTLGKSSANDGYGGRYYWDPAATGTDDGDTTVQPTDVSGAGRWIRIDGGVPPGSTMMWWTDTAPAGWLLLDGALYLKTDEPRLFGVLGTTYGDSGSGLDFKVPDPRGRFMRGTDLGAGNDPDAASRTDRGDTTAGDAVGTKQNYQYQSHAHAASGSFTVYTATGGASAGVFRQSNNSTSSSQGVSVSVSNNGGNETRPININVNFIMKR